MISFMVMSNILSEQMKQQYKSKSVFWRQEKEKLLQQLQPNLNNTQSQQRSRKSQRKNKYRYLVDSLYHQVTPENNKSIYNQFQNSSQLQQQQKQQSSSKKNITNELSFSTIKNKYQKQLETTNNKQIIFDPFAEQIIESFQELQKKRSVKIKEIEDCSFNNQQIINSGRKLNVINKINQIREFLDQQLGGNQDDTNIDIEKDNQNCLYSERILRNKSVDSKLCLQQRNSIPRNSVLQIDEQINKSRSSKSYTTLDVGIQVSLINNSEIQQKLEIQNQNIIQNQQIGKKLQYQENQQNATQNQQFQIYQEQSSQYSPLSEQLYSQQLKQSERRSRKSEFQQKRKSFINIEEKQNTVTQVIDLKNDQDNIQTNPQINLNEDQIFSPERLSNKFNINCQERVSVKQNNDLDQFDKSNLQSLNIQKISLNNKENFEENYLIVKGETKKEQEDSNSKDKEIKKQRNLIQIPKKINNLNLLKVDSGGDFLGQITSVDSNRCNQNIFKIFEEETSLNFKNILEKKQQQDCNLVSNQSLLSITDPTIVQQTNRIQCTEQIEVPQSEQRFIDNATVITDGNLQYSEDTPKLRIITQMSNNHQDEAKYQGNSQIIEDNQSQNVKQESLSQQQIQSNIQNCMNSYSFEQWLQQTENQKQSLNFNSHSQLFQKQKCDHSTQINKNDSDSDEEIQFIKKKQQQFQLNQGVIQLFRNIQQIIKIRKIKSFYEIREYSFTDIQKQQQQQQQQSQSLTYQQQLYQSPIISQYSSQISYNTCSTQLKQNQNVSQPIQPALYQLDLDLLNQTSREQAACEKIQNLLQIIKEETGSDTLRLIQNKQVLNPKKKYIEKIQQTKNQSCQSDKQMKNSTSSQKYFVSQLNVEQLNNRIKVNLIQDMELESPKQKHTEHAELKDNSPIAEPMEFQEVQTNEKQKREIKEINQSNNNTNGLNNQCNELKNFFVLSNHIASQKAKIARKFQQIHYKSVGQSIAKKENLQI
ncbi:unnamed protein product [Paramecium sonneborni]|uniref:Uncharacterized protein n=1 Tax=Paramecium sonneborni TaxID=65129 RepID=A0A8S1KZB6_9CILI|nr:unnamed protein product [Paramecium sonneborni]